MIARVVRVPPGKYIRGVYVCVYLVCYYMCVVCGVCLGCSV